MAYSFKRSDLKLTYVWTASKEGDNAKITGFPDNVLLDRNEGYEVLPFIIRFVNAHWKETPSTVATGQQVEQLIRKCPTNLRSHRHITDWIVQNWNS
jgi:hypothetical protein